MKSLNMAVLFLAVVGGAANATSFRTSEVAPVVSAINIVSVGARGEVAKRRHQHPTTHFLLSIPVTVNPGSACTHFVGQQTNVEPSGLEVLRAVGSSDALNDVCIQIAPMPIATTFTVKFDVLTGGFAPANPIQKKIVQIAPLGLHEITLDMGNDSVTVRPLARRPR